VAERKDSAGVGMSQTSSQFHFTLEVVEVVGDGLIVDIDGTVPVKEGIYLTRITGYYPLMLAERNLPLARANAVN
jgi:hypothetical protein